MKQLLSRRLGGFLLAASLSSLAAALGGCQQDPQSVNNSLGGRPFAASTPPAHPAVTYGTSSTAIGVMDSDGTHQTSILTVSGTETVGTPTWSPSGGSIAYQDAAGGTSYVNSVKAMDISVNAKGVPVSSNVRSIYSTQNSDTAFIVDPSWCSVSTTAKIAFIRRFGGTGWGSPNLGLAQLCVVSQSGGTPTVLASYKKLATQGNGNPLVISHYTWPTWSPDDSKIAVVREDTIGHNTIMIYDASTGAAVDSIAVASNINNLGWSRTGTNELVFSGASGYIYYCTPTTGSTPTTNSVAGNYPTWSPSNSSVMYVNSSLALMKLQSHSSSTSSLQTGFGGSALNWKR